ncbi:MAG: VCBS repeat-containing protein [bacterium]|nr:VCBS repeat-containing protein [bacterium]
MRFLLSVFAAGAAAAPATAQLSGTLNFDDVTPARVQMTVPEAIGSHEKGLAAGDFDQDGDLDVAMAVAEGTYGSRVNKLYRNDGGVLVEVSGSPIIPEFCCTDVSRVALFRDFDLDGWLDLVIVNDSFEFSDPVRYFRNDHPGGVFASFVEEGSPRGLGLDWACGGAAGDLDSDGDQDLVTGNYGGLGQDVFYRNDGTGNFTEVTPTHVPSETDFTIDCGIADMNGDGKQDLLISNDGPFFIYYNDLLGQGSEVGDFRYGSGGNLGKQLLGSSSGHGSLEPADFDGDGRVDIYWTGRNGAADFVLHNQGNGADGKAAFVEVATPEFVASVPSIKSTIADFDQDGRPDVLVMTPHRPAVLRNVSVPGEIRFVDWSPQAAFPADLSLAGVHAIAFDSDGGGQLDILVGGTTGDHLFDAVPGREEMEADLGGNLPALVGLAPLAVFGLAQPGASDTYTASDLGGEGFLSAILRGDDDLRLEVLVDGAVVASSDRAGLGVTEGLQIDTDVPGAWSVRVTSAASASTGGRYVLELLSRGDVGPGTGNDDCEEAVVITIGETSFVTLGASTDGPPHTSCYLFGDDQVQSDVWFDFLAPCTGTWTVSTCGTADFDTKIALYEGRDCPVDSFRLLNCEEDTAGCAIFTTTLSAQVIGGQWYKVRLGGYLGQTGVGTISVSCTNEPGVENYCGVTPNSAGDGATLSASGSRVVQDNDLRLAAVGLPLDQPGYFLASATADFISLFGGSQGNLCLGPPQYRFSQSVLDSGSEGRVDFGLDQAGLPSGMTIAPGEAWHFQMWFRDQNPDATSNTSDGLRVEFL